MALLRAAGQSGFWRLQFWLQLAQLRRNTPVRGGTGR